MGLNTSTVKQWSTLIVASLLVVSVLGTVPITVLAQAHQPNDIQEVVTPVGSTQINSTIRENATPIENGRITGTISSTSDVDWYVFQARSGEHSVLLTKSAEAPGLDPELYAPDVDANIVDDSSWASAEKGDRRAQVMFTAEEAGTYYLKVQPQSSIENISKSTNTSYTVRIFDNSTQSAQQTTAAGPPQEIEPNEGPLAASSINGTQVTGEIAVQGDSDWYMVQLPENETVPIALNKPVDERGLNIELYGPFLGKLYPEDEEAVLGGERRVSVSTNSTTTYIKISAVDSTSSNIPYTLYVPASAAPETPTPTATPAATPTATSTSTPSSTASSPSAQTPTGTQTPTETPSDTGSNATAGSASDGDGATGDGTGTADGGGTGTSGPGFGTIGAIVALLAAALFAARRQ